MCNTGKGIALSLRLWRAVHRRHYGCNSYFLFRSAFRAPQNVLHSGVERLVDLDMQDSLPSSFECSHVSLARLHIAGHIALSSVTFPAGTTGYNLDILARTPLWSVGLNYKYDPMPPQQHGCCAHKQRYPDNTVQTRFCRHGTGHGVGAFLNVHEGPHLISYYPRENDPAIKVRILKRSLKNLLHKCVRCTDWKLSLVYLIITHMKMIQVSGCKSRSDI